jgi:5-methylcytosine-specific restriction enzyme A
MPPVVYHTCAAPGCPALLPPGVPACATHTTHRSQHAARVARIRDDRRDNAHQRGYTRAWHVRRRLFLQRYPLCGMRPDGRPPVMSRCADLGLETVADQVDHVVPHGGNHARFWDEAGNWQALCAACGARKSQAGF